MNFKARLDGQSTDEFELYESSDAHSAAEEAARWLVENGDVGEDDFPFCLVVEDSDGREYGFEVEDGFDVTEV